jgi:hypothetical protein
MIGGSEENHQETVIAVAVQQLGFEPEALGMCCLLQNNELQSRSRISAGHFEVMSADVIRLFFAGNDGGHT